MIVHWFYTHPHPPYRFAGQLEWKMDFHWALQHWRTTTFWRFLIIIWVSGWRYSTDNSRSCDAINSSKPHSQMRHFCWTGIRVVCCGTGRQRSATPTKQGIFLIDGDEWMPFGAKLIRMECFSRKENKWKICLSRARCGKVKTYFLIHDEAYGKCIVVGEFSFLIWWWWVELGSLFGFWCVFCVTRAVTCPQSGTNEWDSLVDVWLNAQ